MTLPVPRPVKPMLAKLAEALPEGEGWLFEPKWDGFRVLLFRDGASWHLQSRDLKPLERYFPEVSAVLPHLPDRAVVDGELVIANDRGLDFEALQMRLHPAASRVEKLSREIPASLVVWDLLAEGDDDLRALPFAARRERLEKVLAGARPPLHVTPLTRDRSVAADWFQRFEGAGLDGVMAKREDGAYAAGKRTMVKVKHRRTADCVVGGFRWHRDEKDEAVGSLLLGLFDEEGKLHHVGVAASFGAAFRRQLAAELGPLRHDALEGHPWREWAAHDHRLPGGGSRWSGGKSLEWEPVRAERVVEVRFDHMQGRRFRHTAHFARWRPDRSPVDCSYAQLEVVPPYELKRIFAGGGGPPPPFVPPPDRT